MAAEREKDEELETHLRDLGQAMAALEAADAAELGQCRASVNGYARGRHRRPAQLSS